MDLNMNVGLKITTNEGLDMITNVGIGQWALCMRMFRKIERSVFLKKSRSAPSDEHSTDALSPFFVPICEFQASEIYFDTGI